MIRSLTGIVIAALLIVMALLSGCASIGGSSAPPGSSTPVGQSTATVPVAVQIATVQRGGLSNELIYTGNIQARQQVSIVPKVSGRVIKMAVEVGSAVNPGDVLVEIEKDALAAQVAQAEAGLAAAQARLDGLRAGPRAEQVAQAEANLKGAQARLDQLKAGPTPEQIAAAEAQVRLARNQLFSVQTQADAYLGSRAAAMGQLIFTQAMKEAQSGTAYEQVKVAEANLAQLKAGPTPEQLAQAEAAVEAAQHQLALARQPITQHDIRAAEAAVAQAQAAVDLARIQLAEATVKAPFAGVVSQRLVSEGAMVGPTAPIMMLVSTDTEVVVNVDERALAIVEVGQSATLTTSAYPGEEFAATVTSVAPTFDARSRTVQVRLSPQDEGGKLRDGMFAEVRLAVDADRRDVLIVPKNAVVDDQGDTVVYVIADGRAKRQVVTTGATDGRKIEIIDGLVEGQNVAITNVVSLRDGVEVSIQ